MKRSACGQSWCVPLIASLLLANDASLQLANAGDAVVSGTQPPQVAHHQSVDLKLAEGGLLVGQIVDGGGAGKGNVSVTVWFDGRQVAQTVAQADGTFAIRGLRGGVHLLTTATGATTCRLWTNDAAPPHSAQGLLLVDDANVARGQTVLKPKSGWYSFFMTRPLLTVGVVATAIAVPVGVAANAGRKNSGS